MTDRKRHINESADKVRVKTQVKRGSGTRDQDTVEVKVKGSNPEVVVEKLNQTVTLLTDTTQTLRDIQPDH